jgi:transcriptional regulator with GAF, ATPase, and Fis domain
MEEPGNVPESISERWQHLQSERARIDEEEEALIREALTMTHGVLAHAARELGVARTTLASRIEAARRPRSVR